MLLEPGSGSADPNSENVLVEIGLTEASIAQVNELVGIGDKGDMLRTKVSCVIAESEAGSRVDVQAGHLERFSLLLGKDLRLRED